MIDKFDKTSRLVSYSPLANSILTGGSSVKAVLNTPAIASCRNHSTRRSKIDHCATLELLSLLQLALAKWQ